MTGKSECEIWISFMVIYKTWNTKTENKHRVPENYLVFFNLSRTEEQKAELKWTNHKKFTAYFSKSFYLTMYHFKGSFLCQA